MHIEVLEPLHYGCPQRRSRCYLFCLRLDCLRTDSDTKLFGQNIHQVCLDIRVDTLPPLQDFLYPFADPLVKEWLDIFRPGEKKDSRDAWVRLHQNLFEQDNIDMTDGDDGIFDVDDWVEPDSASRLSEREKSVLQFHLTRMSHNYKNIQGLVLDLSQSIDRTPMAQHMVPCVTPGAVLLMLPPDVPCTKGRLLCPPEFLRLQGIDVMRVLRPLPVGPPMRQSDPGRQRESGNSLWRWRDLTDLAGNAFNGNVVGAALVALLASIPPWPAPE